MWFIVIVIMVIRGNTYLHVYVKLKVCLRYDLIFWIYLINSFLIYIIYIINFKLVFSLIIEIEMSMSLYHWFDPLKFLFN